MVRVSGHDVLFEIVFGKTLGSQFVKEKRADKKQNYPFGRLRNHLYFNPLQLKRFFLGNTDKFPYLVGQNMEIWPIGVVRNSFQLFQENLGKRKYMLYICNDL